jgi:hypothetical protein
MSPQKRNSLLRWTIYATGLIALCGFTITKSPTAMRRCTAGAYRYGDLYRYAKIKRFKPTTALCSADQFIRSNQKDSVGTTPSEAEPFKTVLFGDSFSFVGSDGTNFAEEVKRDLNQPVYTVNSHKHNEYYANPLLFFADHPVTTNVPRTLIYEVVERSVTTRFGTAAALPPYTASNPKQSWAARTGQQLLHTYFKNSELNAQALVKESRVTFPLSELYNTWLFEHFGTIGQETPVYSTCPPFLFYSGEADRSLSTSFYAPHTVALVNSVADHIAGIKTELANRHRVQLLMVMVPNKFTLYSYMVGETNYDNFLPRVEKALKDRGVNVVELLPVFRAETNLLYWPSDTHWNEAGMKIAANQTAKYMSTLK